MHPRSWTLTTKLIASVLALFIAVTVAIGGATVLTMNRVLEGQVAEQLRSQTSRLTDDGDGGGHGRDVQFACQTPSSAERLPPNTGDGVVRLCTSGSTVVAGYSLKNATVSTLSDDQVSTLENAGVSDSPKVVDLGGDLGDYLVQAQDTSAVVTSTGEAVTVYTGLPMARAHDAVGQLLRIVSLASLGGFLLMGLLGTWLVRNSLVPLRRVADTANRVSALDLSQGEVALAERVPAEFTNPRTEVGAVGTALNSMLDHVDTALTARHQSEMRVRQFVADASHELRTPLASIRGYAELSRREREPVPTGVRHALDRIESEAKRMTGLVEDLLLLARLDAGRPLEHSPVDLTMLLIESVGDIRAAAPEHHWQLELPDEPVEVLGDGGRLKQVVVNLLANARAHTPAGTHVTAGLAVDGDRVRLSVHDDGPGIPKSLQPNLFQRFTRADEARNRAAGSTGLGLSIVDAVVKAHRGDVRVDSVPGSTTFTVTLPVS